MLLLMIKQYIKIFNDFILYKMSYISNLKVNHLKNPLGIDIKGNTFSFLSNEKGPFKASLFSQDNLVQSREVKLEESNAFSFKDPLEYNSNYKLVVESSSSKGELNFETSIKLSSHFIKPKNKSIFSPIFFKNIKLEKEIKKARLYITGLGLYQAFINDKKVGNAYLTPGFNDYDYYLRYQTYDITELLKLKEENKIEIHMGDGWYKGRYGVNKPIEQGDKVWGDEYKLCLNLLIYFKDEKEKVLTIESDESWKVRKSKEVSNGIYDGEEIDYTLPESNEEDVVITEEKYNLIPDYGALIVEKKVLKPELYISPKGEQILDFKQNMVGFIRYKGDLNQGQELVITHGEVLQQKNFYNGNYRSAKATAKYKGDGKKRIFEPKFTFFGFRYALIKGLEKVDPKDFEGVVIYTDLEKTLKFKSDSENINKLVKNCKWGNRGNFLDVPTDCPQRDERLGWTADTQVFVNTACYNMDSYIFYRKCLRDLRGEQTMYYNGDIPSYCPSLKKQAGEGGAVWADAASIIPWNLYFNYGDKVLLESSYSLMKDYAETLIKKDIAEGNKKLIFQGFTFGDWAAQDGISPQSLIGGTDLKFIKCVYYYRTIELISFAAKELGKEEDFQKYDKLKKEIYNAILDEYFTPNGKFALDTQAAYVLSLYYKIYRKKERVIEDFKERLKKDSFKIKTGFTGTPLILLSLFDNDMDDYAYRILFNEKFPGWIYCIKLGATTIWERWNSLLEDGTISGIMMNSLNHYAYGSVCETIFSRIVGLRNISPGWKKVLIKPQINYRLKNINFSFESISGKFEINWKWENEKFKLNVVIPNGVEAEIILPNKKSFKVSGGKYDYECEIDKNIYAPLSINSPIMDILSNEEANKAFKELLPNTYRMASGENDEIRIGTIKQLNSYRPIDAKDNVQKFEELLSNIRP